MTELVWNYKITLVVFFEWGFSDSSSLLATTMLDIILMNPGYANCKLGLCLKV